MRETILRSHLVCIERVRGARLHSRAHLRLQLIWCRDHAIWCREHAPCLRCSLRARPHLRPLLTTAVRARALWVAHGGGRHTISKTTRGTGSSVSWKSNQHTSVRVGRAVARARLGSRGPLVGYAANIHRAPHRQDSRAAARFNEFAWVELRPTCVTVLPPSGSTSSAASIFASRRLSCHGSGLSSPFTVCGSSSSQSQTSSKFQRDYLFLAVFFFLQF